ncbi:MAG: HAD-IA family hydrolase, partial [Acidobacteriales bacterium]|nr:HAD-IA family hydrolase [Terriglobales bacterium]
MVHRPIPFGDLRLLIFDLDGTLIDSRQDLVNSVNAMLRYVHRPELPDEIIASYIGDGAPMLVRRALGDPDDEGFVHSALDFFLAYYREHKLDHTYVYDGVLDSLAAMREKLPEVKMAVLTNKPVHPARAIVDALGLKPFFFQTYGGNSFPTKKPDPVGVEALLREAGEVSASRAVLLGDSAVDMLTARNAGIYSVGCTFGLAPHTLDDLPGDIMVASPEEWKALLEGGN